MIASFILGILTFVFVPVLSDSFLLPKQIFLALGTCLLLFLCFRKMQNPLPIFKSTVVGIFLMGAGLLISSVQSPFAWQSYSLGLGILIPVILFWVLPHFRLEKPRFLQTLVSVSLLQVGFGVIQLAVLWHSKGLSGLSSERYFAGTLGNSEYLAYFLGLTYLTISHEKKNYKHWIIVMGLLLTRSKVAWLGIIFSEFLFHESTQKFFKWKAAVTVSISMLAVAVAWKGHLSGLNGRWLLNLIALESSLRSHFLGAGFEQFQNQIIPSLQRLFAHDSFRHAFQQNAAWTSRVHNEWLDILVEGGVLTLAGTLLLLRTYWISIGPSDARLKKIFFFVGLMSILSFPFHVAPNLFLTIALVVFLLPKRGSVERGVFYFPKLFVLVLVATVLGLNLLGLFQAGVGSYFEKTSFKQFQDGQFLAAEATALHSLKTNQASSRGWLSLAKSQIRLGKKDEAILNLNKAQSLGLQSIDLLKLKASLLYEVGRDAESASQFEKLALAYPTQVTPYFMLAQIHLRNQQWSEARRNLEKIQTLKPTSPKASAEKLWSYRQWREIRNK
jgi:tetratricopeptide (TPR) repeat protein